MVAGILVEKSAGRAGADLVPDRLRLDQGKVVSCMDVTIDGRPWTLGDSIGSGGFGRVYCAVCGEDEAVVKLVPKDPGAQRELLLVGDLSGVPNVVPVLGVGDAGDSWAILMKRAEQSLRDLLESVNAPLDQGLALPILLDVAQALVSLEKNGVVHRDLKPDNILLADGHWCLADFGISRYAEATTAADTRKYVLTQLYGAPEQWRGERATSATDIYAFGIAAFEILTGSPPFIGPDLRSQHLHDTPPTLSATVDNPLRSIIDECLIKAPQARPTPERLLARLQAQTVTDAPTGGAAALIAAHHAEVQRLSEVARRASAAETESQRRAELFDAAGYGFLRVEKRLASVIHANAPSVSEGWPMKLGAARLELVSASPFRSTLRGSIPFDVIANATITIDQSNAPGGDYVGRSHSLWYCDVQQRGRYGWFETAFMRHPLMQDKGHRFDAHRLFLPFSASPDEEAAQQALAAGMGTYQLAWPFTPLVDEGLDDFVERWTTWFAEASTGHLQEPRRMPERNIIEVWRG